MSTSGAMSWAIKFCYIHRSTIIDLFINPGSSFRPQNIGGKFCGLDNRHFHRTSPQNKEDIL
ncbi:hypothetical protein HUJ04_007230 [Dendroctonus ponderosae]|nr:hypothetical protein HUJ04_007230 [Dendroctonus ponderosae]